MTTTGSDGFFNTETAGPNASLSCLQPANPTDPTAPDPVVCYATITAATVASFTISPGAG